MSKKKAPPRRQGPAGKRPTKPAHDSAQGGKLLPIKDLAELFKHEKQIVRRINATLNGGYLFMTNPLLLFRDIGVSLSPKARSELLKREPRLTDHSATAYLALKNSKEQQSITFNLRGLFEKDHP